jgi:hypothetical protein
VKKRKLLLILLIPLIVCSLIAWRLYVLRERDLLSRPLIAVLKSHSLAQTKALLDRKKRTERGNYPTALLLAVTDKDYTYGDIEIFKHKAALAKLLLEHGADINTRS